MRLVNLWKIGVLMYELAYGNVPFPVEYVVRVVIEGRKKIRESRNNKNNNKEDDKRNEGKDDSTEMNKI